MFSVYELLQIGARVFCIACALEGEYEGGQDSQVACTLYLIGVINIWGSWVAWLGRRVCLFCD